MKKVITDPAVLKAQKTPDEKFAKLGGFFEFDRGSTVKEFGRNRVLKGQRKNK